MMKPNGNGHKKAFHLEYPPQRVVSLVPSMTESLFDLGMGQSLVGITDYCSYPDEKEGLEKEGIITRIGGVTDPRVNEIINLKPDLVIANKEENPPQAVTAIEDADIPVWVTFPKTISQVMDILWILVGLFRNKPAAVRLETLELTLSWARAAENERKRYRYFCPIWQDEDEGGHHWWMTFNADTYMNDLLSLFGGDNVFAERVRRFPLAADLGMTEPEDAGNRDDRYPRVTLEEVIDQNPQLILLPDEPYKFTKDDVNTLIDTFTGTEAVKQGQVHQVEGSLITWYGTRLARALRVLPMIFSGE